jgi:soluble lytic murein transglycosylase-like protein
MRGRNTYTGNPTVDAAINAAQSGVEYVEANLTGWPNVNDGPVWVPVLNNAENRYGLPQNLLARQAYEESRFRKDVISGVTPSPVGALGIMQLMPQWFASVQVPPPFTALQTQTQILEAAAEMKRLFGVYNDWGLALAAYNWGQGNVSNWLTQGGSMPDETTNYVKDILTDVPLSTVLQ